MLPAAHRLTQGEAFRSAVRTGHRSAAPTLVVHLLLSSASGAPASPARVGFVVSRSVGGAVVRNRVQRRLRHLVRDHLTSVPEGSVMVVRALPPAARASSASLGADLARCLDRVLARAGSAA